MAFECLLCLLEAKYFRWPNYQLKDIFRITLKRFLLKKKYQSENRTHVQHNFPQSFDHVDNFDS